MNYQNVGGVPASGIPVADKNSMYATPSGFPPSGLYQQTQPTMPGGPGSRLAHAAAFSSVTQAYAPPFYTPSTGYSPLTSPYQLTAASGAYPGMAYSSIQPVSTSPSYPPAQYSAPTAYLATQAPSSALGPSSTLGPTSAQYASAIQGGSQVVYPTGSISPAGYGYQSVPGAPGYQMSSMGYPASLGGTPSFPPGASLYGPRF